MINVIADVVKRTNRVKREYHFEYSLDHRLI